MVVSREASFALAAMARAPPAHAIVNKRASQELPG